MLYYKNVSLPIAKRLFHEVNVYVILSGGILIAVIDTLKPYSAASPIFGWSFFASLLVLVSLDVIKLKSRIFILIIGVLHLLVTFSFLIQTALNNPENGVVLFYGIGNVPYYKTSVKFSAFLQIALFSIEGLYTIYKNKNMSLMMFATGHIYRETGTSSSSHKDMKYVNSATFKVNLIRKASKEKKEAEQLKKQNAFKK